MQMKDHNIVALYVCRSPSELQNMRYLQFCTQSLLQQSGLSRPRHFVCGCGLCGTEVEACETAALQCKSQLLDCLQQCRMQSLPAAATCLNAAGADGSGLFHLPRPSKLRPQLVLTALPHINASSLMRTAL